MTSSSSSPGPTYNTTPSEAAALERIISPERFKGFEDRAASTSCVALDLYLWDRDLAAAALGDIAILEVALRNAMDKRLEILASHREWYDSSIEFDDRSRGSIKKAKKDAHRSGPFIPARVIAQLMFGFWPELLEAGGVIDKNKSTERTANYEDDLWRAGLSKAFPGGRLVASHRGEKFDSTWMHTVIKRVHALRNRAGHHESLYKGITMPGQQGLRITVEEAHEACILLAKCVDRDLGTWFEKNSQMAKCIPLRPPL
jgi:hypothetical protein